MTEAIRYSAKGEKTGTFALPADLFDGTVNEDVLHRAVTAYLNNQRQGTAKTKTRAEVSGGNQKPWKQKGTGRARQGSTRAPHWRGGGTVFGPIPRSYQTDLPKKIKQLARKSALNARAREGALHVVEAVRFAEPSTKALAGLLAAMGAKGQKALVLTAGHNPSAYLSGRNIPTVEVLNYTDASAYDILWSDVVVIEEGAFTGVVPAAPAAAEAAPAAEAKAPAKKRATKKAAETPADGEAPAKPKRTRTKKAEE